MKQHATTRGPAEKEGSSSSQPRPARRDLPGGQESSYDLNVSYFCTMKPQRVYPLVVEVKRGKSGAPAEGPTGVTVTLRPTVPGALVAPAELPLEVSRPGARATFQVTPVARGRLPEACVRVLHDGRQVQELRTRMTVKTQRTTWVLFLLALILPPLVVHWAITNPLRGGLPMLRKAPVEGPKVNGGEAKDGDPAKQGGGGGGLPPLPPPPPPDQPPPAAIPGTPGELLRARINNAIRPVLPNFPYSDQAISGIAIPAGTAYDVLCQWAEDLNLPFWLAVGLLIATFGSWTLHKPARVRTRGSLALPRLAGTRLVGETGETLPLARAHGDELE